MFRLMIVSALVAGIVSAVLFSVAEQVLTVPLIVEAERYENTARELLSEADPPAAAKEVVDDHAHAQGDDHHDHANSHSDHPHAQGTDHHDHAAAHSQDQANSHSDHPPVQTHVQNNNADHSHDQAHKHGDDAHASHDSHAENSGFAGLSEHTLYSLLANVLMGIMFALLLAAAMTFYGKGNVRLGVVWGMAGYLAVFVSPSLGLPPELPSIATAAIEYRQLWWILTVIATLAGLAFGIFAKSMLLKSVGLLLLVMPHIVGAPVSTHHGSLAPEELSRAFIWMTAIAHFIFWLSLGVLTAFFLSRFKVLSSKVSD